MKLQYHCDCWMIGHFKKQDKYGRWRKFWEIGNAGVGYDVVALLRLLGHEVEVFDTGNPLEDL
jgi:hypothetical protein